MPAYDAEFFAPPAPVAKVDLRDPNTGRVLSGVPMLIDSGADVTMIPEAAMNDLAAPIEAGAGYEVMAFDGDISVAHVARMEVVFLGRTFKGRFLIINQPYGVLGRNVINRLCLVLNGPSQTWDECPRSLS